MDWEDCVERREAKRLRIFHLKWYKLEEAKLREGIVSPVIPINTIIPKKVKFTIQAFLP